MVRRILKGRLVWIFQGGYLFSPLLIFRLCNLLLPENVATVFRNKSPSQSCHVIYGLFLPWKDNEAVKTQLKRKLDLAPFLFTKWREFYFANGGPTRSTTGNTERERAQKRPSNIGQLFEPWTRRYFLENFSGKPRCTWSVQGPNKKRNASSVRVLRG